MSKIVVYRVNKGPMAKAIFIGIFLLAMLALFVIKEESIFYGVFLGMVVPNALGVSTIYIDGKKPIERIEVNE